MVGQSLLNNLSRHLSVPGKSSLISSLLHFPEIARSVRSSLFIGRDSDLTFFSRLVLVVQVLRLLLNTGIRLRDTIHRLQLKLNTSQPWKYKT